MAEKESGENYKEAMRSWRLAEEQSASNCFLWDSVLPAADTPRWLFSTVFIIFQHL